MRQTAKWIVRAVLAGMVALAGHGWVAQAQTATSLPDAQVEANVLRALAGASDLSTQNIQSSTVYGTVTLTGNVQSEALRVKAENLAARAQGVKKVVDELTLGDATVATAPADTSKLPSQETQQPDTAAGNQPQGQVLQSDGTYAPADNNTTAADNGSSSGAPADAESTPPPPSANPYYPNAQPGQPPAGQPGYPQGNAQGAPQDAPQGQPYADAGPRQPMGAPHYMPPPGAAGGQRAGMPVTVPAGATLEVRMNRGFDSQHVQPGAPFTGIVMNDIVADGAVAIPRGATVQGTVVDAKKAGVLKGEGALGLQLTSLTLGGTVYPISTQVWQRQGRDKAVGTVNRTLGLGVLGAIIGGVAGGGSGAAIGAGVGGATGLASSAGSPGGQVWVAPESVLSFSTAQPTPLRTVSEAEMARLAYTAGPQPGQRPPMRRYYSPYYGWYYAPASYGSGYYPSR